MFLICWILIHSKGSLDKENGEVNEEEINMLGLDDENSNDHLDFIKLPNCNHTKLPKLADKIQRQSQAIDPASNKPASASDQAGGSVVLSGEYLSVEQMKPLQRAFGRFVSFNGGLPAGRHISASQYLDALEKFLVERLPGTPLNAVANHFYCLIDKSLYSWYFGLTTEQRSDWAILGKAFVAEIQRVEQEQRLLVHLNQKDFNEKLLKLYPSNDELKKKLDSHPTRTYFDYKTSVIKRVYRDVSEVTAISMALTLMTDQDRANRYRQMIDKSAMLFSMKQDDVKDSNTTWCKWI